MAKVYCFGNTSEGELGLGGIEEDYIITPQKQRLPYDRRKFNLIQLASGRHHTLLLLRHIGHDRNEVFSCGSNQRSQLGRIGSWKKIEVVDALSNHSIIQIACGANHSLAFSEAGQVFSWGCNTYGQCGLGNREQQEVGKPSLIKKLAIKNVIQVACGNNHCLALTKNGELFSWGSNTTGEIGIGSNESCISSPTQITALQWTPIRQIAAGGSHSAILCTGGALYLWGKNLFGQLGLNDQKNRHFPALQTSLRDQKIAYICLGDEHSSAITSDGGLFTFGQGTYGQLGHGKNSNEILPRKVFELMGSSISQVSCGRCHTLVATTSGRVYSFGLGGSGQLGIGSTQSKFVPTYVRGKWVEINVKDVLLRDDHRSLCKVNTPERVANQEINLNTLADFKSEPATESGKTSVTDSAMEIEEVNDDDNSSSDNDGNFIIEEPDDVDANNRSASTIPDFLCKDNNTVFTSPYHSQIQIDEYETDPDSDFEEFPDRKQQVQVVLKEVVASKGDQSFVLVQQYSENASPKDFRKMETFNAIAKLDNAILEQFKDAPKDSIPMDLIDYIEEVFCSIPCWNASYINQQEADLDFSKNPNFAKSLATLGIDLDSTKMGCGAIDWQQALHGFTMIENAQNERINELIYTCISKILANMPDVWFKENRESSLHLNEDVLRVYQLLPLFHLFRMNDIYSEISQQLISSYAMAILSLSKDAVQILKIWWGCLPKHYLKSMVHIFKKSIQFNLQKQHEENNDATRQETDQQHSCEQQINKDVHKNLAICLDMLKLLFDTNKSVENVSYKEFYIDGIAEMFDLKMDYMLWKNNRATSDTKQYFLCNYPFIFDAPAKNLILDTDSEIIQKSAAETSMYRQILFSQPIGGQIYVDPYFHISVHRTTILQETINQLCLFNKHSESDFKKPLQVHFEGEEAIDAGLGIKKEYFLLIMSEILDPKYGMWMENDQSNTIWFHHASFEDDVMYQLIGTLCGLAIFNKVIINLPFPLVLYKKILKEKIDLDALGTMDPLLCKNLKEILMPSFGKEEFNAIFGEMNFTITLLTFGSPVEFELCPNGKNIGLTYDNRAEYVRLYWQYILDTSVEKQFSAFRKGFMKVLDTDIIHIFHAEEIMQLVSGQEVSDWTELESATEYKPPFSKDHPTIRLFWKVFHSLTTEEKKKFLFFLTGCDRIPILGVKALKLAIQPMKVSQDHLPVAHTCFNILDLPQNCKSESKLRSKLLQACEYSKGFALV